jgi:bacterioferritin (cytochrome b1)
MNKNELIDILKADLKNEWKHLRFYLYHASAVTGPLAGEYKELFLEEAAGEMKHVTEFSDLIIGLGGVAIAESNQFELFSDPFDIFSYALKMEEEVVSNYVQRMKDADALGGVDGQWVEIFMENQIQKSREDVDQYRQILKGFKGANI